MLRCRGPARCRRHFAVVLKRMKARVIGIDGLTNVARVGPSMCGQDRCEDGGDHFPFCQCSGPFVAAAALMPAATLQPSELQNQNRGCTLAPRKAGQLTTLDCLQEKANLIGTSCNPKRPSRCSVVAGLVRTIWGRLKIARLFAAIATLSPVAFIIGTIFRWCRRQRQIVRRRSFREARG